MKSISEMFYPRLQITHVILTFQQFCPHFFTAIAVSGIDQCCATHIAVLINTRTSIRMVELLFEMLGVLNKRIGGFDDKYSAFTYQDYKDSKLLAGFKERGTVFRDLNVLGPEGALFKGTSCICKDIAG